MGNHRNINFHFNSDTINQHIYYSSYKIPSEINNKIAIDLGCNVGLFVAENHTKFEKLYAIDASYQNFLATLKRVRELAEEEGAALTDSGWNVRFDERSGTAHIRDRGVDGPQNIACFNLAAAKDSGEIVKIYRHDRNGNSVSPITAKDMFVRSYAGDWDEDKETYHNVHTISLEGLYNFFDTDYIDYLKIDIEGAEYDFLLGKDLSRIGSMGIEIHGTLGQAKKDQLKEHIAQYFDVYSIDYDNPAPEHSVITYINKELK